MSLLIYKPIFSVNFLKQVQGNSCLCLSENGVPQKVQICGALNGLRVEAVIVNL